MTMAPSIQTLVDQIVRALGFPSGMQPIGLDIDLDDKGLVMKIEPRLRFKGAVARPGGHVHADDHFNAVARWFVCQCGATRESNSPAWKKSVDSAIEIGQA